MKADLEIKSNKYSKSHEKNDIVDASVVNESTENIIKNDMFKTVQKIPRAKGPNTDLRKGPNDELLL